MSRTAWTWNWRRELGIGRARDVRYGPVVAELHALSHGGLRHLRGAFAAGGVRHAPGGGGGVRQAGDGDQGDGDAGHAGAWGDGVPGAGARRAASPRRCWGRRRGSAQGNGSCSIRRGWWTIGRKCSDMADYLLALMKDPELRTADGGGRTKVGDGAVRLPSGGAAVRGDGGARLSIPEAAQLARAG